MNVQDILTDIWDRAGHFLRFEPPASDLVYTIFDVVVITNEITV